MNETSPVDSITERMFTPYDIQNCLYDRQRVEYFRQALAEVIKPGDVVVDAGSGTGVLGLLAARLGAATVYCLELNREYVNVIRENARHNGLSDQIHALQANAASVDLPEQVDVIISEMISGGLFYEPQSQIVRNLRRFMKKSGTVVPQRMINNVELIEAQVNLYGLDFCFDTRHRLLPGDRPLTNRVPYLDIDFRDSSSPSLIRAKVTVTATHDGTANAIRIPYALWFSETVYADRSTEFLLNPQVIYLPQPIKIVSGRDYRIGLAYTSGDSPLNMHITVTPETDLPPTRQPYTGAPAAEAPGPQVAAVIAAIRE